MNTEKYIVRLTDEERQELAIIVKKLKGTSQKVNRALTLLHADVNGPDWTNEQIAARTGLTERAITNIRKQFVTEGFEIAIERQKRRLPPVPKKLDGLQATQVIATRFDVKHNRSIGVGKTKLLRRVGNAGHDTKITCRHGIPCPDADCSVAYHLIIKSNSDGIKRYIFWYLYDNRIIGNTCAGAMYGWHHNFPCRVWMHF